MLAAAEAAAADGLMADAVELYAAVLQAEPENAKAIAGLARLHLDAGEIEQAKASSPWPPRRRGKAEDPALAAVRAALALAEQAADLGDMPELEARIAANPPTGRRGFDLALALNARNRREEAVDQLIAIIRADRAWNEDGRASSCSSSSRPGAIRMMRRWPGAGNSRPPCSPDGGAALPATGSADKAAELVTTRQGRAACLSTGPISAPANARRRFPLFPPHRCLVAAPRQLPLNIFEPRYMAMIDDALAGHRLIGMIQPDVEKEAAPVPPLYGVGCVGRITQIAETGDGRYHLQLTGVARFRLVEELRATTPYRPARVDYRPFAIDFEARAGEDEVDRASLMPPCEFCGGQTSSD